MRNSKPRLYLDRSSTGGMFYVSAVAAADIHTGQGDPMLELLNDPQVRAALQDGTRLALAVLMTAGVLVMVVDFARFLRRGGDR